ncbi:MULTISPECIES: hypothetical protein [unclassified Streptomyces]|uniref:hypothetical protein n=1 Tax=unclassified Streptomyces TaxID=2593676 RepID=UPI00116264C7|nr:MULTISPECIES: hypothetical protein [unclassified Streptomyces]NMI62902.1 hypothetical protein [Streptomyces sp. RLA2-12]QDN61866.1 hypothetical protein FNV67_47180 [Streptomyces sp. S1D4-20]QDN71919.1 hypothetical protein FNV66_46030 [Streptomyces sp. S1D4-14]QDN82221.1 hypothetical protein FNV64_47725 [Streptomyces sp. S1A1-7]QDO54376.1 hypothetical protein FNV60_44510 [Streptomyces sp. RLB3-5]
MGLVGSFEAVVLVERHLFALIDNDPGNEEPFARIPGNSAFLIHEDSVVVASDLADQLARVRVEIWDAAPDGPAGDGFRAIGEVASVSFESGRIQLVNLMREPAGDEYALTSPGPYRVRVWAGPQEEDAQEELEAYRFFERFVIQLSP